MCDNYEINTTYFFAIRVDAALGSGGNRFTPGNKNFHRRERDRERKGNGKVEQFSAFYKTQNERGRCDEALWRRRLKIISPSPS